MDGALKELNFLSRPGENILNVNRITTRFKTVIRQEANSIFFLKFLTEYRENITFVALC